MNDREKLIEIVRNSLKKNIGKSCKLAENIVDDIIGAGVIVPPCKVGDMVYIFERGNYIIPICGQGNPHWEIKIEKCSFKYWLLDNHKFGVNMFSTREEAEKALKEGEDNG